jgi:hypothetical protein
VGQPPSKRRVFRRWPGSSPLGDSWAAGRRWAGVTQLARDMMLGGIELRCVSGAPDPGHCACVDCAQAGKALRDLWLPRADLSRDVSGAVVSEGCGMVFVW